jgi:hypothetical protein
MDLPLDAGMQRALNEFLDYCRLERRLAPLTCSAYERDVRACLAFLAKSGIRALDAVGPADLRRFLAKEAHSRPAPSSQARATAALKCFFRFLVENEELARDPAAVLRSPRKREALPDVLDLAELRRCSIGAVFGLYGQLLLSHALASVTGFPVVYSVGALVALWSVALVSVAAAAIVAVPGYLAARVTASVNPA